jgi:hypothetical protein
MPPNNTAYLNLQETMAAITRAASMMGVSVQEAGEALKKISATMKPAITEMEKRITEVAAQKDKPKPLKQESAPPQPSLFEEFEIPHYEIETVDIEYSIDF